MEPPSRVAPRRSRRGIVPRPRLSRALDRGREAALTSVVAPAGYGKTIAVEMWLAEGAHVAAWVLTDARDDDPVRLWSSVARAVDRARPGLGGAALARLSDPSGVVEPAIEALATSLAADDRPIVVVLEDLQSIGEARCLRSIDHAVAALPEHVQLVVMSRTVPRLRMARLRTQGELAEIGADELAFTVAEAQALLAAVDGFQLDEAVVATLNARTEGWAAVLYLAALWLRDRQDPAAQLRAFRASQHRHVSDYLAGEVLGDLDADTGAFLQEMAVLPQMCGELCDAVLRRTGSRERLEALELATLLVIPLADRPGWYRYHALLRDYLIRRLDRGDAATLRRRALAWSRDHGLVEDAVEYARAVGDVGASIALIEEHALRLVRTGRSRTLVRWTAAIPRSTLVAHPRALAGAIGAAHLSGRPAAEIRRLLVLAGETGPELMSSYEGAMLQIARALYSDDVTQALRAAQVAVDVSRADEELLVPALSVLALIRLLAGDDGPAAAAARAALEHPDAAQRPYGDVTAAAVLAILAAREGRRHIARSHADRAIAVRRQAGLAGLPAGAPAHLADAVTSAVEGRLAHAREAAQRAVTAVIAGGVWEAWARLELAGIELQRGRMLAAEDALAHACELLAAAPEAVALNAQATDLRKELDAIGAGAPERPSEALSPAELAVLRLLPGRTVREVADALYLSTNTVKSHTRAVYRKLGVSAREDALARARTLGLLDDVGSEAGGTN